METKRETLIISSEEIYCKGIEIPFEWRSDDLGRAEFDFCPVYKSGILREFHITPRQQHDIAKNIKIIVNGKRRYFTLNSYQDLNDPRAWNYWWCKEHKCQAISVYVPNNSKYLWIELFSDHLMVGFIKNSHNKSNFIQIK